MGDHPHQLLGHPSRARFAHRYGNDPQSSGRRGGPPAAGGPVRPGQPPACTISGLALTPCTSGFRPVHVSGRAPRAGQDHGAAAPDRGHERHLPDPDARHRHPHRHPLGLPPEFPSGQGRDGLRLSRLCHALVLAGIAADAVFRYPPAMAAYFRPDLHEFRQPRPCGQGA